MFKATDNVAQLLADGLGASVFLQAGQQIHQVTLRGGRLVLDMGDSLFSAFGDFHDSTPINADHDTGKSGATISATRSATSRVSAWA